MDTSQFPDILPRKKPVKKIINKAVLFVLGRALQSLSKSDPFVQDEVRQWPKGFTLQMNILPEGSGSMTVQHTGGGRLHYLGTRIPADQADVAIFIKNIESAFRMFTAQLGADVAYAQHAMIAKGDLSYTVSVVRVLNIVEAYLFPGFIARNIMKELPPIPFLRKQGLRLKTYLVGILFGI